ncbi:hypothetical protein KW481_03090 [Vibrio fluvialis]|nr:hypothetical protein [Vibrio fluvialis]
MNKEVADLTYDDVDEFLTKKFTNKICPVCGIDSYPSLITNVDRKVNYTYMPLYELDHNGDKEILTTPVLPLMCQRCGHLTYIATLAILNYINAKGVQ